MGKLYTAWKNFYLFNNFQSIGAGWMARYKGYMPSLTDFSVKTSALQVALWATGGKIAINWMFLHINFTIPEWINWGTIFAFLLIKFYVVIIFNTVVGKWGIKKGLLELEQNIGAKHKELSPYNREVISQLEAIGNKLDVESKFSKYD